MTSQSLSNGELKYGWPAAPKLGMHITLTYIAARTKILSTMKVSAAVVLKLLQKLWTHGHHIYTDRYYTSPYLLYWLHKVDLLCTGTCMTNRIGFPRDIVKSGRDARNLAQGSYEWKQCQNTGFIATRWTDKKPIYFLTSGLVAETSEPLAVERRNKEGQKLIVAATPSVVMYNKHMGGVDHNDKMARLDKSRKAYKWYSRLDRKCIQWSLYNAYVLFKTGNDLPKVPEFRTFVLDALTGLIGDNRFRRNATATSSTQPQEIRFKTNQHHMPVITEDASTNTRCVVCEKKYAMEKAANPGKPYRELANKSVKSAVMCDVCNVYLCVKRGSTCWRAYHTKVQYWR